MQKQLHPNQKTVTIICTDGSTYEIKMMLAKTQLKLDLDPKSHAVWNHGTKQSGSELKGQLAKFRRRFSKSNT